MLKDERACRSGRRARESDARARRTSPAPRLTVLALVIHSVFGIGHSAFAAVQLEVSTDRVNYTVGDFITLRIGLTAPKGTEVKFGPVGGSIGGLAIADFSSSTTPAGAYERSEQSYELEAYIAETYTIPSFEVRYKLPGAKEERTIRSAPLKVVVGSFASDEKAELREIRGPVSLPSPLRWYYVAPAPVIALVVCLILYLRRRKPAPWVPPYEIAYRELEALMAEDLIAKGLVREFHYRLTDIVRHYIEREFRLRAPELTTEEFLAELARTDILSPSHKELLKSFLEQCDLVKYARHAPAEEEVRSVVTAATRFIDETARAVAEAESV